jgi:hypothetical protein
MPPRDLRTRETDQGLCSYAEAFERIVEAGIFSNVTEHTSKEQCDAALEMLNLLRTKIESGMSPFHYPAPSGTHYCVADTYMAAVFRLKGLALLRKAPPPPAPRKRSLTPEDVVKNLEEAIKASSQETFLGSEQGEHQNS